MKTVIATVLITLAAAFSAPVIAASDAMRQQASAAPHMVDGVVKKVDKSAGKMTIAHGPLLNLDMPGMTMAFRVKEAAWLDQVRKGDKIRFMADNVSGAVTVVHLETAN